MNISLTMAEAQELKQLLTERPTEFGPAAAQLEKLKKYAALAPAIEQGTISACFGALTEANRIMEQISQTQVDTAERDWQLAQAEFLKVDADFEANNLVGGVPDSLSLARQTALKESIGTNETYARLRNNREGALGRRDAALGVLNGIFD